MSQSNLPLSFSKDTCDAGKQRLGRKRAAPGAEAEPGAARLRVQM